ncbi:MAG: DUF3592 domain-containing protein [Butyrivibrio sp.]|nr:DUF3592 domain-containing protein [Butyrivibrio sp.]
MLSMLKENKVLLVGIVMFILAFAWFGSSFNYVKRAELILGEVARIDKSPRPVMKADTSNSTAYVSYKYNGERYDHVNIHTYSHKWIVGQSIYLYCDPDNPLDVRVASSIYKGPIILFGLALFISAFGLLRRMLGYA